MINIDVPGFGRIEVNHLVSDFTGTLSEAGCLCDGVRERINELSRELTVHILTADTFGRAKKEIEGVNCKMHILSGIDHDMQKEHYVKSLDPERVVALGNGKNDRKMLKAARVGIAVCLKEGCSTDAIQAADVLVSSAMDALDLLINPIRLKATLRF
jgi:soluble P-type ATPase